MPLYKKISELPLGTTLPDNGWLAFVDVNDTTESPSGTTKKISVENYNNSILGITAKAGIAINKGQPLYLYGVAGVKTVQIAEATAQAKEADAFALENAILDANIKIAFTGEANNVVSQPAFVNADIGKPAYLSDTVGKYSVSPPTGTGKRVQRVGIITGLTSIYFSAEDGEGIL